MSFKNNSDTQNHWSSNLCRGLHFALVFYYKCVYIVFTVFIILKLFLKQFEDKVDFYKTWYLLTNLYRLNFK